MRERRQEAIRAILRKRAIPTQAALLAALAERGEAIDQSTLSRDLAEIGAKKVRGRYGLVEASDEPARAIDYRSTVQGFFACGPNLIVVRTAIGQAQPIALDIDAKDDSSIAATLAGDDTIFIATKTRRTQAAALRRLVTWFGDKREG